LKIERRWFDQGWSRRRRFRQQSARREGYRCRRFCHRRRAGWGSGQVRLALGSRQNFDADRFGKRLVRPRLTRPLPPRRPTIAEAHYVGDALCAMAARWVLQTGPRQNGSTGLQQQEHQAAKDGVTCQPYRFDHEIISLCLSVPTERRSHRIACDCSFGRWFAGCGSWNSSMSLCRRLARPVRPACRGSLPRRACRSRR